jgi:hypothetical protein
MALVNTMMNILPYKSENCWTRQGVGSTSRRIYCTELVVDKYEYIDRWIERWSEGSMDQWMDERIGHWADSWIGGLVDGCMTTALLPEH